MNGNVAPVPVARPKILLVEDEPAARTLRSIFTKWSVAVRMTGGATRYATGHLRSEAEQLQH
jgi:hypothetical protein